LASLSNIQGNKLGTFLPVVFFIIYCIIGFQQFISCKFQIDSLLHDIVEHFLIVLGLLLLFSKESSCWFKQVKQKESSKNIVSRKYKISSNFLYAALCINILKFIIAVRKGSRLAGIIYIAFIIFTETNILIYANFNNPILSLWSIIVISIQVLAFIVLFQTEIMGFYSKLIKKQ